MPSRKNHFRPIVAITMGDPCGIGPEIIVKALSASSVFNELLPVVIGDLFALNRAIALFQADLQFRVLSGWEDLDRPEGAIPLIPISQLEEHEIMYGRPSEASSRATIEYIRTAVSLALKKKVHAVCTGPIHKANLQNHGFDFPGHTEFLKALTAAEDVVMMLAGPKLRVSLVTIHHPLSQVPELLNQEKLVQTINITVESLLRDCAVETPHIAVAGLNPHAGEQGRFGREESDLIQPAIETFQERPFKVSGPYSPDTVFYRAYQGEFDAVVAMYHDQGLIPIKLVHFNESVNISLGLPIIRTSVDHGTAYELAGTGKANEGGLLAALKMAASIVRNRHKRII